MKVSRITYRPISVGLSLMGLVWFFLGSGGLSSCKKTEVNPRFSVLQFQIIHEFDFNSLELDPVQYVNEAGNQFSITDLKYYLSNIRLHHQDGTIFYDPNIYLVDVKNASSGFFKLDSIPPGFYTSISFDLGIDSSRNYAGSIANTMDNLNMAWPFVMGGGYHFLKFEGKFHSNNLPFGFAFHLGKSSSIIHYSLPLNRKLTYWNEHLVLHHNVDEWFKNPVSYDFNFMEPYSMSSDSVMKVIKTNGADVFSL